MRISFLVARSTHLDPRLLAKSLVARHVLSRIPQRTRLTSFRASRCSTHCVLAVSNEKHSFRFRLSARASFLTLHFATNSHDVRHHSFYSLCAAHRSGTDGSSPPYRNSSFRNLHQSSSVRKPFVFFESFRSVPMHEKYRIFSENFKDPSGLFSSSFFQRSSVSFKLLEFSLNSDSTSVKFDFSFIQNFTQRLNLFTRLTHSFDLRPISFIQLHSKFFTSRSFLSLKSSTSSFKSFTFSLRVSLFRSTRSLIQLSFTSFTTDLRSILLLIVSLTNASMLRIF